MSFDSCIWPAANVGVDFVAAVIDLIAFPVFVKDREFRWVLLNNALCEMVGYPREQMLGKTDYDFFSKEEADFFRQKDVEMFASGAPVVIDEETITDAKGRRHVLATTKVPMRDASGEPTHLVGIIHDITRMKEMEEALRRANEDLEQRVEARTAELRMAQEALVRRERLAVLGRLAGGLAHEIRNPLGAITNAAYVLDKLLRGHPNDDVNRALEIVRDEAWRANRIITDLVEYARVRPASPVPTTASAMFSDVLAEVRVPEHVQLARESVDVPLYVDVSQTRSILGNLLRNAIEAMPEGGTLTLGARREGGLSVLSVGDTGGGIAESLRDRLFEPLMTTKPAGLGLGLTTAKSLAENQGGTIAVSSDRRGTRIEVRLPSEPPVELKMS